MIITVSGRAGAGKSTISLALSKKLKLSHYSTGDLMRNMAKERGISLLELSKIAEYDRSIDEELDKRQVELGKKHNNFVIDGRLSWYFIPHSIKIFMDAEKRERARRILKDRRKEEKSNSIKSMVEALEKREYSEKKRYKHYYGIDCYDKKHYDIAVYSTHTSPKETAKKVLNKLKLFMGEPKK